MTTVRIVAAHGWFNSINQVAPVCTPPNTCFLGPTRVQIPNCILIDSAIFAQPSKLTQPPTLSGTGNEYQKCRDALRLGVQVWFIPLVDKCVDIQVKLCDPLLTCAIPDCFRDEFLMIKRYTNPRLLYFTIQVYSYSYFKLTQPKWHLDQFSHFCIPVTDRLTNQQTTLLGL